MGITSTIHKLYPRRSLIAPILFSPEISETRAVIPSRDAALISSDLLQAGIDFHALLLRMADSAPFSKKEKGYLPYLTAMRGIIGDLGAYEMEIESPLKAHRAIPAGVCDLLVHGGPTDLAVVEVNVVRRGEIVTARPLALLQLGAYARLVAGRRNFDSVWAAIAYIEIESKCVRFFATPSARGLATEAIERFQAAYPR
jgi:hypothetical protein